MLTSANSRELSLQRSNPRFGGGLVAVLAANKGRIDVGMGLSLQQLPDHIARFVDSAEIGKRHGCRPIAARQLRQRQDGASWLLEGSVART